MGVTLPVEVVLGRMAGALSRVGIPAQAAGDALKSRTGSSLFDAQVKRACSNSQATKGLTTVLYLNQRPSRPDGQRAPKLPCSIRVLSQIIIILYPFYRS